MYLYILNKYMFKDIKIIYDRGLIWVIKWYVFVWDYFV